MNLVYQELFFKSRQFGFTYEFGRKKNDHCLVAELNGKIIGAIWVRCIKAYGFFNENIPELAMSLYPEYRGKGIGDKLLNDMLKYLKENGYSQISLSVEKDNFAAKMYIKNGFSIVQGKGNDYCCKLTKLLR